MFAKIFTCFNFGSSGSPLSSSAGVAAKILAVVMTISVHFSQYILYVTKCARGKPLVHGTKKKLFYCKKKKAYVSQAKCFYFGEESGEKNVTQHNVFQKQRNFVIH